MVKTGIKKVKCGKVERFSFSKINEPIEMPYLLDIQKSAYKYFLETGIAEVLEEFSPITDYSGKAEIYFVNYTLDPSSKYSREECKRKGTTYSVALKSRVRLVRKEDGEVIEQDVFLGDVPLMTEEGSFIFNGIERVVVSQIVRSPSVYFDEEQDKTGKWLHHGTIIPTRGTWVEVEQNASDIVKIVVDRSSKVTLGIFLKCFGFSSAQIIDLFGRNPLVLNTLDKETQQTQEEALIELSKKMRPSEIPSAEATHNYINQLFFTPQYYNLARVGRYKLNKKLGLANRITGQTAFEDITIGKIMVVAGETIGREVAEKIQDSGVNVVTVRAKTYKGAFKVDSKGGFVPHKIVGNSRVRLSSQIACDEKELGILEMVHYPTLMQLFKENKTKEERLAAIKENAKKLNGYQLTMDDIIATISYHLDLNEGIGGIDNVDHLANRRVASVGELMTGAFRSGINKLAGVIRETLQAQDLTTVNPSSIINARPVNKALKDFLASSQLSQLMDQVNPISELTQKRKISAVGPGGVKKERATADVRDIHYSHYGRICAIETPEGQGIGLINSLATFSKINEYGFLLSPYKPVDKKKGVVSDKVVYLMADEEENCCIAQAIEPLDESGKFKNARVVCRKKDTVVEVAPADVDYVDVSPRQFISAATCLIPFLANDDTARALMGSNMQRQAVPLIKTETPLVGTGIEHKIAVDSGAMILCKASGFVSYVSSTEIKVKTDEGKIDTYCLTKFTKTNQDTCINQKPNVLKNQRVEAGDVLADGFSTKNGELALGKNMLIAYMNWEGYNYEDAILISERIVKEDIFTSITLKVEDIKARSTKLGDEEITRDIPNLSEDALKNLDEDGIVRIGAEVRAGDILVGKVTPKGETELTPEERLLRAIFGEKAREVRDTSLRVQHGRGGVVVDVQIFTRKNKDELEPGVNMMVKVYVAQKRKLSVGDKMAGRHGNKGVVSRILPESDMPFMANGQPVDIVLNPLGIPSRMNVGQVLEVLLGKVARALDWKVAVPVFDSANENDIQKLLIDSKSELIKTYGDSGLEIDGDGKMMLYDGRTGEAFENRVTVGVMYMIKLDHMVDSKMHARSTGPYSLVTQQPLGGKAMFGGQRFGEMEIWALEAYGVSKLLQEILTVKSDDVIGRNKTYEAIVKGYTIAEPGIPEAFKVLVKEFQSLGLDIRILNAEKQEIELNELSGEDLETPLINKPKDEVTDVDLGLGINTEEADIVPAESVEESIFDNSDDNSLFDDFDE
ncbi:MAG: DNA-directed RNA polymerase subunit beta [Christensenellaceae bacterium]|jgi:DNA-directed RNA polymerase subunit beta|nr:DNA-directed RNA polymerase subunit beta [Christensenellaceae bacterium]